MILCARVASRGVATGVILALYGYVAGPALAQLDSSFTVTVNGRSATVNPDGGFSIGNIPAGTGLVRVKAIGVDSAGNPLFGQSPFVQIVDQTSTFVPEIEVSVMPPVTPVAISAVLERSVLTAIGDGTGTAVTALQSDGTSTDVRQGLDGTTYMSSNTAIATVDDVGFVTAVGAGRVYITVCNEGATTVTQVDVSPGDPLTTLVGFVQLDGAPVQDATITIVGLPQQGTTDVIGRYVIDDLPTIGVPEYFIRAEAEIMGQVFLGTEAGVIPVPGGLTDAGIIALGETGGFGPAILSGMDPEDHGAGIGGAGWTMIQDALRFVVEESVIRSDPSRVVQLGGTVSNAAIAQSAVTSLGFTFQHVTGMGILTVDFMDFDAVYMPTSVADVFGGLSQQDLDLINMRGPDIIEFVNAGGGIAAFAQNLTNGFDWFPRDGLQTGAPSTSTGITLTPQGALILSPSATAVQPFHQAFFGPPNFFGLDVLAIETGGQMQPLIIGGIVFIDEQQIGGGRHIQRR